MRKIFFSLFCFFCLFSISLLFAQEIRKYDILIVKRNNSRKEGKVIIQGNKVLFISKDETIRATYDRDEVEILFANTAQDVYRQKSDKLTITDSAGRMELAKFCLKYDLEEEAVVELKRCLSSDPKAKEAYQMLSSLYSQKRKKFLEQPENTQDIKVFQALVNEELSFYLLAEKNQIEDALISYRMAEIYNYLQIYTSGSQHLEKAFKLAEQSPPPEFSTEGQVLLAEIQMGMENGTKAVEILEKLGEAKDFPPALKYRLLMAKGQAYFRQGNLENAIKALEEAKELIKEKERELKKIDPAMLLAGIYFLKGGEDLKKAEENLKLALDLVGSKDLPRRVTVLANLSLVFSSQGRFKSAEKYAKEAEELQLKLEKENRLLPNPMVFLVKGYFSLVKGNPAEAMKSFEKAAETSGKNGFLFYLVGKNYFEQGDMTKALDWFQQAIHHKFNPSDCLLELARSLLQLKKFDQAARYLKYICENMDSVKFFSRYTKADAFYYLGFAHLKQQESELARQAFEKAIQADGNHISSLNSLAYIQYTLARTSPPERQNQLLVEAKANLQKVLGLDPQNAYAQEVLSQIASVTELKMWEDQFQRDDSPRPYNQWDTTETVKAGIDLRIAGKKLVFDGEQNIPDEPTIATRKVETSGFAKFEVILDVSAALAGKKTEDRMECGIMIQGRRTSLQGKIRLFANPNGVFYHLDETGPMVMDAPEKLAPLPADGKLTLAISVKDLQKGLIQVSVNRTQLKDVQAPSLLRSETFYLQVYGQSAEKRKWAMQVSRVRIFRRK